MGRPTREPLSQKRDDLFTHSGFELKWPCHLDKDFRENYGVERQEPLLET